MRGATAGATVAVMTDEPIRTLLERIAAPASASRPDLEAIATALAALAADRDYLERWIERLEGRPGSVAIHAPAHGPRLQLVHRPEGEMSAVHDHGTWIAIATVTGIETHRRYRRLTGPASEIPKLAEVRDLGPAASATLLPPDDVHDHGHLVGNGPPAHILVLAGADQTQLIRNEWDLATGRHRVLGPGDSGRWIASQPMPGD